MIKYVEKTPSAFELNYLMDSVGWGMRDPFVMEEALKNTLFSFCVYDDDKLIGYGRIIGDKTVFLHIQDLVVMPEYQNRGIGSTIMENLITQVNKYKEVNPSIRTYLGASKGMESFYEKFGFILRPNEDLGSGMILY